MTESGGEEYASRAELALHEQLEVVRQEPPHPGRPLGPSVRNTLRWQSAVVIPITTALAIAGGLSAGFRALAGAGRRR